MKKVVLFFMMIVLLTGCLKKENVDNNTTKSPFESLYDGRHGSAGFIGDKTLIVSIYINDATTKWTSADNERKNDNLKHLGMAVDWIKEQVKEYNIELNFLYDYNTHSDLVYEGSLNSSLLTDASDIYSVQEGFIKANIDSDALKSEYEADNIVYLFYINSQYSNEITPYTFSKLFTDSDIEYSNMYMRFNEKIDLTPSIMAHELLHFFGVPDLYYESDFIPLIYVNKLRKSNSDDIMFTVQSDDEITERLSKVDAYYLGILDKRPKIIDKYLLGLSELDREG